ncbi:MAG: DUF1801 domain-containing protein [Candidatus Magasanikbacteria bacterium]|nr:DUF1801 domain-containing protein [Candidatus Magasanikbacteria bacterium]
MLKNKKTINTIGEYIQNAPKGTRIILKKIRQIVEAFAPKAVGSISYGMPAFKLYGKPLVYFAAWEKHIGFYATPSANAAFEKELVGFKVSKGAIQFLLDKSIPYTLVKKIVLFKAKELQKAAQKICSRGHIFYKDSTHPSCPKCWPGRYKNK